MAEYRLSSTAEAQIDQILDWSEDRFGAEARERYAALLQAAIEDVAGDPRQPAARWRSVGARDVGLYHLLHSRSHVPDPPGGVGQPRHCVVFGIGHDNIVDILGIIHERMLRSKALRRIVRASPDEA